MNTGVSGMTTIAQGDISFVGGSSPESQQFAQKICTKLGACQGATVEMTSPSTGRGR